MKLTYETGIVTQVQFIAISLLNIATQIMSVITACHSKKDSCLTSAFSSTGYFMVIVVVFGFIWMLGYMAQERRSRKLAIGLIGIESLVAIIALHNAKAFPDLLSLFTSLTDMGLALWAIWLAIRLVRAGNSRIIASERTRRRHRPATKL